MCPLLAIEPMGEEPQRGQVGCGSQDETGCENGEPGEPRDAWLVEVFGGDDKLNLLHGLFGRSGVGGGGTGFPGARATALALCICRVSFPCLKLSILLQRSAGT